jgi:hypothetical protein
MLNGITGVAACCQFAPEGLAVNVNTKPVNVGGVRVNVPRSPGGFLSQVGEALDKAIHGGDSGTSQGLTDRVSRGFANGGNIIPFPMVNPFKPVIATGAPVTALTRFPNRFTYKVDSVEGEPDDEQSSFDGLSGISGLGLYDEILGPPPVMTYRPSTLQTILGTIQTTLPATIQAFRASPQNIYSGSNYPGTEGAIVTTSAGSGQAAENVGAGVGRAADTLGSTLSRFVTDHPYLVIGGGAALVLLFMNPPRRR